MEPDFESESWEQTGPSYGQTYVVSGFILVGLLSFAAGQVPLTPVAAIFLSLWFGVSFYWVIQNRRAERTFASHRIIVANGQVSHSFRYAITEVEHSVIQVNDIEQMKVHHGKPIAVELVCSKQGDFFLLPSEDQVERLRLTLQELNPRIRVTM